MTHGDIREAVMFEIYQRRVMRKLFGYGAGLNVDVNRAAGQIGITDVTAALSRAYGEQIDTVTASFSNAFLDELGKRNLIKWLVDEIEKQLRNLSQMQADSAEQTDRLNAALDTLTAQTDELTARDEGETTPPLDPSDDPR